MENGFLPLREAVENPRLSILCPLVPSCPATPGGRRHQHLNFTGSETHIWGACLGGKAPCQEDAGLKSGSLVPVPATLERGDYLMGFCVQGIDNVLIVVGVPRWKESAAVQSILHHSCFPLCSVRPQPPRASGLPDQHCHLQAARATPTPRSVGGQPYCLPSPEPACLWVQPGAGLPAWIPGPEAVLGPRFCPGLSIPLL